MRDQRGPSANSTVNIYSRIHGTEKFDKLFKEGMGLVEETANYLDSQGRIDSRVLDRPAPLLMPQKACASLRV